jgi:20S proteasome alpha/beta subunit
MTIAMGFKFAEGILLCADTQHTYEGLMKTHRTKVYFYDFPNNGSKVAFAFAGSVEYAKTAIQRLSKGIESIGKGEMDINAVRDDTQKILEGIYSRNVFPHPQFGYGGGPAFSLLIACFAGRKYGSRLFSSQESLICEVQDPYICLGAGAYLAEYLLKRKFNTGMSLCEAAGLALGVLKEVKDHVDGCGGYRELVYLRHDGSDGQVLDPDGITPLSDFDSI